MISKKTELKPGMKVGYTSGSHGDHHHNPLWEGVCGKVLGVVVDIKSDGNTVEVEFPGLGTKNTYRKKDLTLLGELLAEDEGKEPERRVQGLFNI